MLNFQAVVFDLDGTLLDSLADIAIAANLSLEEAGFSLYPPEQYAFFVGNGMRTMVQRILPDSNRDDATVDAVLAGVRRHYACNWRCHTRPYPGIPELIARLREMGIHLAVLSNKPQIFLEKQVHWFFPHNPFMALIGAVEKIPLKPDPTTLLALMKTMGCKPDDTLMVGDTAVDMQTARAAGAVAAGVLWGFRGKEELESAGADLLATVPADILSFIH